MPPNKHYFNTFLSDLQLSQEDKDALVQKITTLKENFTTKKEELEQLDDVTEVKEKIEKSIETSQMLIDATAENGVVMTQFVAKMKEGDKKREVKNALQEINTKANQTKAKGEEMLTKLTKRATAIKAEVTKMDEIITTYDDQITTANDISIDNQDNIVTRDIVNIEIAKEKQNTFNTTFASKFANNATDDKKVEMFAKVEKAGLMSVLEENISKIKDTKGMKINNNNLLITKEDDKKIKIGKNGEISIQDNNNYNYSNNKTVDDVKTFLEE